MSKYDLIVIGGGPAGYVGAIRAAQLGKRVACVEKERAGGTCLNWGCIPTKSLLRNAELYRLMQNHADEFGLSFDNLSYDWSKVISRSRTVADRLAGGIEFLFKKNKIDYVLGTGQILEPGKVQVTDSSGQQNVLESEHILVATGCKARAFPDLPFNGRSVVGSSEAMIMENQPEDIVIIGAGAIGVEFAYFFNAFGTKVTIVEMMPNILPVEDQEVSVELEKSFKKSGIEILSSTKVIGTRDLGNRIEIDVEKEGSAKSTIGAEVALIAIGVEPVLPADFDLELDRGYIVTDDNYQTNVPGIYAVGDIIGPPWLAHVASFEATQCVNGLFSEAEPRKVGAFPGCTYCQPQVASVGLTEQAAEEKGLSFKVGKFPYQASGKAQAAGETEGFIKLLIGEPHGEILGAHIIGSEATELIAELGLAIESELTYEEIENTIHAHPTLSEMVHEAVGASTGHAVHI
ncbi:dihydrolipoyl dehydrogenase [Verrucomicrobia bacterium]|nr:dihydrolipoyl dehydrogenase [Verrucomicrobiota bacterium]